MNAAYVPDVVDIEGVEGAWLKVGPPGVRRTGERARPLRSLDRRGAEHPPRRVPAARKRARSRRAGGRSSRPKLGALTSRRRYLETIAAETGDVDITRAAVLVSIGRGIEEQENVAIAEDLAEALGAAVSCSRPVVDAKWMDKSRQVGSSGPDGAAEGLPGLRHQRLVPAPGGTQGQSVHRRHQQESQGPDLPCGGRRDRGRHPGVPAGAGRNGFARRSAFRRREGAS